MDGQFDFMKPELINTKIDINTSSSINHVTEIEIQIHVIKDIARTCNHTILFNNLLNVVLVAMLMNCTL